jgi:tetratricopeptide (TPR) repeat protein
MMALFLEGCCTAPSNTSSEIPPPAPERQYSERPQQSLTVLPPKSEPDISSPPQDSQEETALDNSESAPTVLIPVSHADLEFVQERINAYQIKLDRWTEISQVSDKTKLAEKLSANGFECIQLMEWILTGYSSLLERMEQVEAIPVEEAGMHDPKNMQQLDITFLANRCDEVLALAASPHEELKPEEKPHSTFDKAQEVIVSHVKNEDFQTALLEYSSLPKNYPEQKPNMLTELHYGLALQYTGQVEAAARHFRRILDSGELSDAPLYLQLEMADLSLASGDITTAKSYYENFIQEYKAIESKKTWAIDQLAFLRSVDPESEEMLEYTKLLREFLVYDYKVHSVALNEKINSFVTEHVGSPFAVSILRLKAFTIEQLNFWLGRQLVKIDSLVAEKKFVDAFEILKSMSQYYLPADLQAIIQRTYYEIGQAELQATENQRRIQEMKLTEQWDTAVQLMDSQRFASAISAFENLMETDYEEMAAQKIVEAANLAAGQMRKEAASLFVQAGKTQDMETKKNLLLESHGLLNEILSNFPQTDLLDKVHQNIAILEEQIRRIDPALLEEIKEDSWKEMPEEPQSSYSEKE